MIPASFVEQVLARIDIVDLIERYVPLKKGGANFLACCPFHNEKSPSFTVSASKQFYHCFGCGAHGTAIGFLMEYAGLSFRDAVKDLANQSGLQMPAEEDRTSPADYARGQSLLEVMAAAARYYRDQLKQSPKAIDYLKRRGLTGEVAAKFAIGYAPDEWQGLQAVYPKYDDSSLSEAGLVIQNEAGRRYDRFRDRIMFPILDQRGNVIAFGGRILDQGEPKYLNSPETPLFEKGRELYGLSQARTAIRESGTVVVVEGYMDVVALAQYGFGAAVATLGTATTPTHIQKLFRQAERVVFCFDGDAAGRKAARRALDSSLEQLADDKQVRFLFLPPEHDPDSFVREQGLEAFRRALEEATPLTEFLLRELRQNVDLGTAEGRAKLIHDAKDLVPKVAAPVLRLQLVRALAEDSGLAPQEIERALGLKTANPRSKQPPPRLPRAAVLAPVRQLLRLLSAYPDLCSRIPASLPASLEDSPDKNALVALLDAFDDGKINRMTLAALYEQSRNQPEHEVFADMLHSLDEEVFPSDSATNVLDDLIVKVVSQASKKNIEEERRLLEKKIEAGAYTAEEYQRYKELVSLKHRSQTGQST